MGTDARKHVVPTGAEGFGRHWLNDLSASVNDIVRVDDIADRTKLVAALTAAGRPPSAENAVYVHRQDLPGLEWTPDGQTWERVAGEIASTSLTGSTAGFSAETMVPGLTVTLPTIAGRRYRVEAQIPVVATVAGARVWVRLRRGTTTTAPLLRTVPTMPAVAANAQEVPLTFTDTPGAGPTTYGISVQVVGGGGTVSVDASADRLATLTVSVA